MEVYWVVVLKLFCVVFMRLINMFFSVGVMGWMWWGLV